MSPTILGILLILFGLSFLLNFSIFSLIVPIIIIMFGVKILMRGSGDKTWTMPSSTSSDEIINEVAIFSPVQKTITSINFKGGKIVMIFAGGEIDLKDAKTEEKEINLEIAAVFGGAKLIVPKNWKVNSQGKAIFGGYDNKTEQGGGDITLNIKGSVVFGGIEITN